MQTGIQLFRPALLPDERRWVWYPFMVCGMLAGTGYVVDNLPLTVVPLFVAALFPGLPIVFHSLYFFTVKITLSGDMLTVTDYAGDPFVTYPRRQEIDLSRVTYVYHLDKEAKANSARTAAPAPFQNTRIKIEKYRTANRNSRLAGAMARTDNGLVLSDKEGRQKIYLMRFHDLAKKDWQQLAHYFRERNPDIVFIMSKKEKNGLCG